MLKTLVLSLIITSASEAEKLQTFNLNVTTAATILQDSTDYANIEAVVSIVVPIFFGIIAIIGFFGNILVILVVLLNQQMHSTTNLLIVNLATADLLFVVFCIPFTATDYITEIWPFGDLWCRLVQYLIVVTTFASIYTLVLMSVDRFLAVVHPVWSRNLRTENITKIAIFFLWSIIVIVASPVLFAHGVYEFTVADRTLMMCQFIENDFLSLPTFHITFMLFSYFIPLMIISGLYARMVMRLWDQGCSTVRMSAETERGRKRVTRLVVVVVIAFATLWFPIHLILVLKSFGWYDSMSTTTVILQIIAHILAYTSTCINPLLYAFFSANFRKAFEKAVNCSTKNQDNTLNLPSLRKISCTKSSTTWI